MPPPVVSPSEPAVILVCFAVKEEAGAFQRLTKTRTEVVSCVTGIGTKNAERVVREFLLTQTPKCVLTCGFAGGLDISLAPGAVIFETSDVNLRDRLSAAGAKSVRFTCVTRIATTVAEKAELRRTTQADAVEMESGAIHAVCRERGIPCATVRVISDAADENLPLDFNLLAKPDLNLDYGKLAWAIAKSPGKIGGLMRLQKRCQEAAANLAQVLVRVVG